MSATVEVPQMRDYLKLFNTIVAEAAKEDFGIKVLSTLVYGEKREGYPFLMLRSDERAAKYNVIITAGFHGDEAYAIDSLIHALSDLDTDLFNFWIFPVANPWGYVHNARVNGERKGSNWSVGKRPTNETELIFKNLPTKIDLFIDVHGDVDREEMYAYERRLPNTQSLAKLALEDTENYFDTYDAKTVYKEPCDGGVVTSGPEQTIEEYIFNQKGAPYAITLEIPAKAYTNRTVGGARLILAVMNNFERVRKQNRKKKK
jgi:predicted deacylase